MQQNKEIITLLLKHNADPDIPNKDGNKPSDNKEIVNIRNEILTEHVPQLK
jgi:hypothetical protein